MCTSPNLIRNPLYGTAPFSYTKDVVSQSIYVPCGKCAACRARKQTDILQRVQLESLRSYVYYFTLTYNSKHVPTYTLNNGQTLMHPYYKHVTDMFKRIRKNNYFDGRRFKYIVCSEYTPIHARPHYHGLLFLEKLPSDSPQTETDLETLGKNTILSEWRVNVATMVAKKDSRYYKKGDIIPNKRSPVYEPLLDYVVKYKHGRRQSTYDFKLCVPNKKDGTNDVSYYVTKYLFKDSKQYKRIQALCYKVSHTKEEAQKLIQTVFKTGYCKSLNTGGLFTDESYQRYRHFASLKDSTRFSMAASYEDSQDMPDFDSDDLPTHVSLSDYQSAVAPLSCLEYDHRLYDKVLKDAQVCLKQNKTITISDIYTGKPLPISRSLLPFLPSKLVEKHQRLVLAIVQSKHLDFDAMEKKNNRLVEASQKVFISDLFDDDELITVSPSVDFDSVSQSELSRFEHLDRTEENSYNRIDPDYAAWDQQAPPQKTLFHDPWKDFFKPNS